MHSVALNNTDKNQLISRVSDFIQFMLNDRTATEYQSLSAEFFFFFFLGGGGHNEKEWVKIECVYDCQGNGMCSFRQGRII